MKVDDANPRFALRILKIGYSCKNMALLSIQQQNVMLHLRLLLDGWIACMSFPSMHFDGGENRECQSLNIAATTVNVTGITMLVRASSGERRTIFKIYSTWRHFWTLQPKHGAGKHAKYWYYYYRRWSSHGSD